VAEGEKGRRTVRQRWVRTFPAEASSVSQARRFLLGLVADLPNDTQTTVVLLGSELTTNAVRHGKCTEFKIEVIRCDTQGCLRVEVGDTSEAPPTLVPTCDRTSGGLGVLIVDRLSDRWGWRRVPGGKVTWFEVEVPPRSPRPLSDRPPLFQDLRFGFSLRGP
jgi:anti-sigma regulatory factor (Ser/Thr protein kinase)